MPAVRFPRVALAAAALAAAAAAPSTAAAGDGLSGIEATGSGFLTLAAGKVLGGTHDPATDLGFGCPCFIADFAQGGVYESGGWRVGPDSKLGLQGTVAIDGGRRSLTAQVVSRGAHRGRVSLEWLYGTAELGGQWTLQVGRKRLPLFLSSEVQDVGYALPWVHLPPQLHGWEVVNVDGGSLTWRDNLGPWLANVHVIAGNQTVRDSGYWKIYNGKASLTDTRWLGIVGTEAKLSHGGFDVRGVAMTSTAQSRTVKPAAGPWTPKARHYIYGLSLNADEGGWLGRIEALYIDRAQDYGGDHAQLAMVGRRFGPWTGVLSWSNYRQSMLDPAAAPEAHSNRSAVLRYDWGGASAVKVQFDHWRDRSGAGYASQAGHARLLTFSYDRVF